MAANTPLKPVAEKSGFAVYECDSSVDNNIPQYPIRRKIESEIAKRTFEHLIIFTDPGRKAQVWQWVKRETGKPTVCQEIPSLRARAVTTCFSAYNRYSFRWKRNRR